MPATTKQLADLQHQVWGGSIPLDIRLAPSDCRTYNDSDPYLVQPTRLSYLPFLLGRIRAFFLSSLINPETPANEIWLSFQGVPLKWHYPLGLLYDLYSGAEPISLERGGERETTPSSTSVEAASESTPLPWQLTVHFTEYPWDQLIQLDPDDRALLDSYINAIKEADYLRNGTARTVMSMGKEDSDNLWRAVQTHDLQLYNSINNKLLNPPGLELRHVPIKIYLPSAAVPKASEAISEDSKQTGQIRVVQSLVPIQLQTKQPQTLGTALNSVLPTVFPSRRTPLLAQPVLHGAVLPMSANLDDLGRAAAYADGFLHVALVMLG